MGGGGNGKAVSGKGRDKLGNKWCPLNDLASDGDENVVDDTVDGIEWFPPKLLCTIISRYSLLAVCAPSQQPKYLRYNMLQKVLIKPIAIHLTNLSIWQWVFTSRNLLIDETKCEIES